MNATILWIIAAVIAVIGIIVLISGSVLWGIILLIVAAGVGPGRYSFSNDGPDVGSRSRGTATRTRWDTGERDSSLSSSASPFQVRP